MCLFSPLIVIGVLDRFFQRLRFLQADHEGRLAAHRLRIIVPVSTDRRSAGRAAKGTPGRTHSLLVSGRAEAELLLLLLLHVSEDGVGQEVRVVGAVVWRKP